MSFDGGAAAARAAFTASLFKSIHYPKEVVPARRGSPLLIGVKTDKKLKVDFVDIEFAGQDNDAEVDSLQPQLPGSMLAPPPVARASAPRRSSRRRKSVLCTLPDLRQAVLVGDLNDPRFAYSPLLASICICISAPPVAGARICSPGTLQVSATPAAYALLASAYISALHGGARVGIHAPPPATYLRICRMRDAGRASSGMLRTHDELRIPCASPLLYVVGTRGRRVMAHVIPQHVGRCRGCVHGRSTVCGRRCGVLMLSFVGADGGCGAERPQCAGYDTAAAVGAGVQMRNMDDFGRVCGLRGGVRAPWVSACLVHTLRRAGIGGVHGREGGIVPEARAGRGTAPPVQLRHVSVPHGLLVSHNYWNELHNAHSLPFLYYTEFLLLEEPEADLEAKFYGIPLIFSYVATNDSDTIWLNWYDMCKNLDRIADGHRPGKMHGG
ncbi:hypothetical protein B0H17DRAFT_1200453 [Mycena rosella]|uniref:Uncharacterized protein n=1 Tax=Mycena rosella TaxID=1033263 RepID=A0AAD7DI89_MYCRO|nr:hypothetical protein B0H17DRAFT_1200453 [Mycena rosella]